MSFKNRLRQAEKHAGKGDGTVDITIERCFDRDIEPEYAEHRARQLLGIRPPDEGVQRIFVVGTEMEEKYQGMTPEQARKILKGNMKLTPKKLVCWNRSNG